MESSASIAAAAQARRLKRNFQRGELRRFADAVGGDLVGGNADGKLGFRAQRMDAREPGGTLAGVVPAAVAEGVALHLGETAQDSGVLAERLKRLQRGRELEILTKNMVQGGY